MSCRICKFYIFRAKNGRHFINRNKKYDIERHVERNHPDIDLNVKSFSFIKSITDLSIKPFLQELEQGHDEITDKESEAAGLQILNSESSFISKSSFVSKSAANSSQKQQVIENPSIIETVNKGTEKLLIAVNDLSQHVKGDAGRSKDVERNLRMSNDLADIATKWDKIDNIIDLGKSFPQIRFLPGVDGVGGSVIRCETCYKYIKY